MNKDRLEIEIALKKFTARQMAIEAVTAQLILRLAMNFPPPGKFVATICKNTEEAFRRQAAQSKGEEKAACEAAIRWLQDFGLGLEHAIHMLSQPDRSGLS